MSRGYRSMLEVLGGGFIVQVLVSTDFSLDLKSGFIVIDRSLYRHFSRN
jgi:hypothetical protein